MEWVKYVPYVRKAMHVVRIVSFRNAKTHNKCMYYHIKANKHIMFYPSMYTVCLIPSKHVGSIWLYQTCRALIFLKIRSRSFFPLILVSRSIKILIFFWEKIVNINIDIFINKNINILNT